MSEYRAYKEGRKWFLRFEGTYRSFSTKSDLLSYLAAREKRLTAPGQRRVARIVWEAYR